MMSVLRPRICAARSFTSMSPNRLKLAALMIEEQIDIGFGAGLAARGRAEQVEMLHAERLQLRLVLPQFGYGRVAIHG